MRPSPSGCAREPSRIADLVHRIVRVPKGTVIDYGWSSDDRDYVRRPSRREQVVHVLSAGQGHEAEVGWETAKGEWRSCSAEAVEVLDNGREHHITFLRYDRGSGALRSQNTQYVGYKVKCSCGDLDVRINGPKPEAEEWARHHVKEVAREDS